MCGIIVTKNKDKIPLIKHRGIEVKSEYRNGFHFAHHRLPIQTRMGDDYGQPISLKDGSLLLYNGEIFNFPNGYDSDVAYLIDLFNSLELSKILQEANKWDGFWSVVYLHQDSIYAFTDPLGKKQLYYNSSGEICSEIRPLIRVKKLDEFYKSSVFKWGYTTTDHTPYYDIKRIEPNKLHVFNSGMLIRKSPYDYFHWWKQNTKKLDLYELMYRAVESRLISLDYPIGALISGGLDSSIIAYLLNEMGAEVNYYSIENGESEYVEHLTKWLGIDFKYLNYSMEDDSKEAFTWNETPVDLGSVVPQHKIMSVIPERIVLTGDGADELFGGYRRINTYDSQKSDVFEELPYYHLPRLDRASMRYTIELRNPFLSHDLVKFALNLPLEERTNKKILKDTFLGRIPPEIINRRKVPLKNHFVLNDPMKYKAWVFDLFYNQIF